MVGLPSGGPGPGPDLVSASLLAPVLPACLPPRQPLSFAVHGTDRARLEPRAGRARSVRRPIASPIMMQMPRAITRCLQCGEPVTPYAAGCAICGADIAAARDRVARRHARATRLTGGVELPRLRPGEGA